jgi:gluconolactonase
MRRIAFILLAAASLLHAEDYVLGPESQPQPGVPKGVVSRYKLDPGKYYPGVTHSYSIYVPARYNAAKPAAFMIFLDGSGAVGNSQRVPVVFDNLIAKGDLPPLIGIFIDPGVLPALTDSAQSRYERIFEYDNISDRFSHFLEDELLPAVAKKYNLSKDPNDHAISGVSTGAVGAFVAAWERPDMFHRVLSFIGTFVSLKGADTLPATIRRTEPKPIRVFLQAGKNDHLAPEQPYGVFYGGSWPTNNQVMYDALRFGGYDVKLVLGEEGHNMKQGAAIMPEALRWLWRDYPKPIVVREPAAITTAGWEPRGQVYSVVSADKQWEQVGETYKSVGSPASDKTGNVFFADPVGNRIYKSDADRKVTVFKENSGSAKVLRFGPDGLLYASQPARKRIVSFTPAGEEKTIAQNVDASDLAITAKGEIYFTDTSARAVGYIDAKGQKRVVYSNGEIALPGALSLSPDQAMLIVGDAQTRFSWSFQIAKDGSLINGEPFYRVDMPELSQTSGVSGVTVDTLGQAYFATALGIQYCEQNGRCAGIVSKPERGPLWNIAFGGKDLNWMYVAENNKLFRRSVKVKGVAAWAPVKAPKPPL